MNVNTHKRVVWGTLAVAAIGLSFYLYPSWPQELYSEIMGPEVRPSPTTNVSSGDALELINGCAVEKVSFPAPESHGILLYLKDGTRAVTDELLESDISTLLQENEEKCGVVNTERRSTLFI